MAKDSFERFPSSEAEQFNLPGGADSVPDIWQPDRRSYVRLERKNLAVGGNR